MGVVVVIMDCLRTYCGLYSPAYSEKFGHYKMALEKSIPIHLVFRCFFIVFDWLQISSPR